ncbi:hypothetical protein TRFO_33811 [Tritrichomonas foetus]|uniref:Uncharacterized protein n=1 Tax=Tritrichomonas foetus TaxID=1144522 RepID=A0A1J4JKW5_9EUKA|nr:hypothetical protein TRFO_33811 [Tritrichomonas foetus]|eukprot:OHS99730.1 hypothetical protein TRFO_33811 [Tritrichomonas foetus]
MIVNPAGIRNARSIKLLKEAVKDSILENETQYQDKSSQINHKFQQVMGIDGAIFMHVNGVLKKAVTNDNITRRIAGVRVVHSLIRNGREEIRSRLMTSSTMKNVLHKMNYVPEANSVMKELREYLPKWMAGTQINVGNISKDENKFRERCQEFLDAGPVNDQQYF